MKIQKFFVSVGVAMFFSCSGDNSSIPVDAGTALDASSLSDSGSIQDAGLTDSSTTSTTPMAVFTHKMMKRTGENLYASLGYECDQCTFEQHSAIVPPTGWMKGPTQVSVFTSGEMRSRPSFEGVPDAVDFVPEVPGEEYKLIVKNLDATIIERASGQLVARATVMRDTLLRFAAGRRVHELTSPEGEVFVLFVYDIDPRNPDVPDFDDENVLGDFNPPMGWTYTSRILTEELRLDTKDTTSVLAIRGAINSTWEVRKE